MGRLVRIGNQRSDHFEFEGTCEAETDNAVKFRVESGTELDGDTVWFPISQVIGEYHPGDTGTIVVKRWIAEKKLLCREGQQ